MADRSHGTPAARKDLASEITALKEGILDCHVVTIAQSRVATIVLAARDDFVVVKEAVANF